MEMGECRTLSPPRVGARWFGGARNASLDASRGRRTDKTGFYDRFRGRVMFTIADLRKRVVGFGGRVLGEGTPKYLNSPDTPLFKKGQTLFALDHAREAITRTKTVIVVEGYFDAIALHQPRGLADGEILRASDGLLVLDQASDAAVYHDASPMMTYCNPGWANAAARTRIYQNSAPVIGL